MKCSKRKIATILLFIHIKCFLPVYKTMTESDQKFFKEHTDRKLKNCKYQKRFGQQTNNGMP